VPTLFPEPESISRADLGTEIHRILEQFDFQNHDAHPTPGEYMDSPLQVTPTHQPTNLITRFLQSSWPIRYRKGKLQRELSFVIPFGIHQIHGKIDVILEEPDGRLVLLDYKTGAGSPASLPEKIKKQGLDLQQQIYALAIQKIIGHAPDEAILYFLQSETEVAVDLAPATLAQVEIRLKMAMEALSELVAGSASCQNPISGYNGG
jgi:ATP-dependent exoDNAse (exonuclease V) beta subunit